MVVACSSTRFSSSAMRRSFASSLSAALARDARSLHLDFEQNSLLGPRRFEADSALQFLQRQPAGAAPSAAPSSTVVHTSIEPERAGSCFLVVGRRSLVDLGPDLGLDPGPNARGKFTFGSPVVITRGPWGLAGRT